MSEELKTCPFCGGTAVEKVGPNHAGITVHWVACRNYEFCAVSPTTHQKGSARAAAKIWNTRKEPDEKAK